MQALLLDNGGLRSLPPNLTPAETSIHGKNFSLHFPPRVGQLQWPNSAIIRSEGSRRKRPQQRSVSSNKPRGGGGDDELKRRSKSPDNDEILALFRRIQSSISKEGEAKVPRRRRRGIADSVSPESRKSRESGKEQGGRGSGLEDAAALENSKIQRPLSKFVRRSPIPVASPAEDKGLFKKEDEGEREQEVKEVEEKRAGSEVSEMQKIDEMKLSELKGLARGEGIKGISKLKKGELLQLLKERLKTAA
ncbi:uncharacterized protein LOC110037455 isoform X2 [Phalaenopsis equestris]|uniref:uncharacterized protein LOC110037455 isoform X2 n=1 Tax=Phalaenopsis equestris TaxID=78828 RepID=UPI0009E1AA18|nr:uncharacterized protein LOC110037455 isoform X2 [Phalaenopsis equestris]